ncbi:hypothetical protein C8046_11270 [Serinibacter arcticus]|uniref:Uncharacterized protein n=1 Tax=Serinibacter arcticus TaxID=1655435 RepID=A0A2U1ZVY1_9MICO|nr:hypothetical protein [Serinibacter arcticus]PWD51138.1 hypothetical protein C8046_11270 [Serinibacter arcticus]
MPSDTSRTRTADRTGLRRQLVWTGLAVVVLIAVAAPLLANGDGDTAAGVLTGGGLVVAAGLAATWWSRRRADRAGTATRVLGGTPDERDSAVFTRTAAVTGVAALAFAAAGSLAVSFGVDAATIVSALPFALLVTVAITFVVVNRRT